MSASYGYCVTHYEGYLQRLKRPWPRKEDLAIARSQAEYARPEAPHSDEFSNEASCQLFFEEKKRPRGAFEVHDLR
jgi:hypothetical protein